MPSGMRPRCGSWISPMTTASAAEHDERDQHDRRRLVWLEVTVSVMGVGVRRLADLVFVMLA